MSERGQGQGGQGGQGNKPPEQPPPQQSGKEQKYVVKATFTDDKGKQWTAGTAFSGDSEAVRKALAAGQIEEQPA